MNHAADIARELGLDHMVVYNILHPNVECERCGMRWDTISPCAPCRASEIAHRNMISSFA